MYPLQDLILEVVEEVMVEVVDVVKVMIWLVSLVTLSTSRLTMEAQEDLDVSWVSDSLIVEQA